VPESAVIAADRRRSGRTIATLGHPKCRQIGEFRVTDPLDRTQEVGGSSPASSIASKPLHVWGFRRFGDRLESPMIALHFRH
jgi:hypothetical protein